MRASGDERASERESERARQRAHPNRAQDKLQPASAGWVLLQCGDCSTGGSPQIK